MKNEKEIASWFEKANPFSKQKFEYTFDNIIGYGINKVGNRVELNKATVVLKKMDDGSIKIHTSYPRE